ncbi:hypothetical protein [Sphaerisporangium fuscum]|uniref:hypothetical protein n=1 Tax=Sphaerisporangium fuscum TaxID=2835868 RepID=UPI001BDCCE59|nr:hypothetical protein [Sphaerisporangium fuscum]
MSGGVGVTGDLGADDFDRLIEATRRALESVTASPPDLPEVRHQAGRRDGAVRAEAVLTASGPRLACLDLDPRVRRLDSAELAELILGSVNEALEGLAGAAGRQAVPDLDTLPAELRELQDLAAARFGVLADTITDVLRQLERRNGG